MWALFTTLILAAHADTSLHFALLIALRIMVTAALLGLVVQRFAERVPWPSRVRPSFVAVHLVAAFVYAAVWVLLNSIIDSVLRGAFVLNTGPGITAYLMLGIWIYVMVAGVSYTTVATERAARAARAEANAARAQLAALRARSWTMVRS